MNRLLLPLLAVVGLAGCVVHHVGPPPPPPAPAPVPVRAFYYGEHALPGGGWCYVDGPHEHDFFPQQAEYYAVDQGYYVWRGPVAVTYYAGHPMPGGGWCPIPGPHVHEYFPPRDDAWVFRPGHGYLYRGPYSSARPPPAHYWVRPVPAPVRRVPVGAARPAVPAPARPASPAPAYAPQQQGHVHPAPGPAAPAPQGAVIAPGGVRPVPAPAPAVIERPAAGASAAAPGHGNVPPGQGGTPPGQAVKPAPTKPAQPAKPKEGREHRKHDDEGKPRRVEP